MILKKLTIFFTFLLLFNLVSSLDITLSKTTYFPEETLQAEISGEFLEKINPDNIGIYFEDSVHKSPGEANIVSVADGEYLYYSTLPREPGNYQLRIEDQKYLEGFTEKNNVSLDFEIKESNESYLIITPGFIFTSSDFELTIKAKLKKQSVNVEFSPTNFKQTFDLGFGLSKTAYISIASLKNYTRADLKVNSYKIPIIVMPKVNVSPVLPDPEKEDDLREFVAFDISSIQATLMKEAEYLFQIMLVNKINQPIPLNISSDSPYLSISPKEIKDFTGQQLVNISIKSDVAFSSEIKFSYKNASYIVPVKINVTSNVSNINLSTAPVNSMQTCSEKGGKICLKEEKCSGEKSFTIEGTCCLGTCSSSGGFGWLIGILIFVVIIGAGFFLYKKYKSDSGFKDKFSPKKKSEDYLKRFDVPKEVKDSLEK